MNQLTLPASTGSLQLREEQRGEDVICAFLDPRVEARNAFALKRYLQERLKGLTGKLILDISKVDYVDSSGLGALIGGLKAAPRKDALVIVRPKGNVCEVFRITRTESLFNWTTPDVVVGSPA